MQEVGYHSKDLVTWITNAMVKEHIVCSVPAENYNNYNRDDKLIIIMPPQDINAYRDQVITAISFNMHIKVNDIPANILCGVDCHNIGDRIQTNDLFSGNVLKILQVPLGRFIEVLCDSDQVSGIAQVISGLDVEIDPGLSM